MTIRTKGIGVVEDEEFVVARDGQAVRVPLVLMDSTQRAVAARTMINDGAGHRPGYALVTDADRERRRTLQRDYDATLSARWKKPPPVTAVAVALTAAVDKTPTRTVVAADPYETYDAKLARRWKGAA